MRGRVRLGTHRGQPGLDGVGVAGAQSGCVLGGKQVGLQVTYLVASQPPPSACGGGRRCPLLPLCAQRVSALLP